MDQTLNDTRKNALSNIDVASSELNLNPGICLPFEKSLFMRYFGFATDIITGIKSGKFSPCSRIRSRHEEVIAEDHRIADSEV